MRDFWTFHSAGQIIFGRNAIRQIREVVARLGAGRVLIVTDAVLARAGQLDRLRGPLWDAGLAVEIFDGGEPEPAIRTAEECIAVARAFEPQVVIGLGGGSNMDLAKVTATVVSWGWYPQDYFGEDRIPGAITPVICVPTTAGTGSEVSGAAVLTDTAQNVKVGILSNYLRPAVAIIDPLLTVSCPPKVTADSGMDALTHAIEAYTAVDNAEFPLEDGERTIYQGKHPLGDLAAEKAITLVGTFLRRAVTDGNDLEAREGMALAALLGGLAFSNVGVAVVHALEYPVGAATRCSHGAGNGLLLPAVMRYNLSARRKEFAAIARLLGEDVRGLDEQQSAERAVEAVDQLRQAVGVPGKLRELGAGEADLRGFAEKAFAIRRILRVNPRRVSVDDLEGILRSVY